jgi:translocon-associated protein subunit alpha
LYTLTAMQYRLILLIDPLRLDRLFMYIVVLATLGGLGYFAYNALMEYYYPQQKRTRSSKRAGGNAATADLKVVPAESGKPYPASVKPYEEDWVPSHHLKPAGGAARKRKGVKVDGGASSAAEVTSGGEGFTSGGESASEKKKGGKKGKRN